MSHFLSFWIFHRRTNKNQKNESLKKLSIVLQRNLYIHSKVRARKLKILYIFLSSRGTSHITVKNHQTWTKFEVHQYFVIKYLYFNFIIPSKVRVGNRKFLMFFRFKKHNSVNNHRTWTKFKLDLNFLVKYLYMQFPFSIYIHPFKSSSAETENFLCFF